MDQPASTEPVDWAVVGRAMHVVAKTVSEDSDLLDVMAALTDFFRQPEPSEPAVDREAMAAAELLGVSMTASVEEIRRACRKKIMSEGLHPDHGGDEERARRVIAARDLLIAKVRS